MTFLAGCAAEPLPPSGAADGCILVCAWMRSIFLPTEAEPAAVPAKSSKLDKPAKIEQPAKVDRSSKLARPTKVNSPAPAQHPAKIKKTVPPMISVEKPAGVHPRPKRHKQRPHAQVYTLGPAAATARPLEKSFMPRTEDAGSTTTRLPVIAPGPPHEYTQLPGSVPIEENTTHFEPLASDHR